MPNNEAVLSVRDLSVYYGEFRAIKNISLSFQANKVTALIGPSGCGKSTLLRCLNRMNDLIPQAKVEGEVVNSQQDIYDPLVDPAQVRLHIGMVFQKPNPFTKSIFDNVAFGLKINGLTENIEDSVEKSLRSAALWDEVKDRLDESAMTLSGGRLENCAREPLFVLF